MTSTKKTALVTGASAGIGDALARELAARGIDLVITARRRERLEKLAEELRQAHGVTVHVEVADLSEPSAPEKLWKAIEAKHIAIDYLINNAGVSVPRTYENSTWEEQSRFIQLLVTTPAQLTHLALPKMLERGYGRVVAIASLAAYLPGSLGNTLYSSAKGFVVQMIESLALELQETGKDVMATAVLPGFTRTEMHAVMGNLQSAQKGVPAFMWMDAQPVARQTVEGMLKGETIVINGRLNAVLTTLMRRLPTSWVRAIARRESRHLLVR
jgi:uncharacterized protein